MVYRVYVEKKRELANEANALLSDVNNLLNIKNLTSVRIFNRYDVENIDKELFFYAQNTVFSEPQLDIIYDSLPVQDAYIFAVEFLPGQFDQRADSAAQCIQIISQGERPVIRSAKVYALYGTLSDFEISEIKNYVINPVEAREASLDMPSTLKVNYDIPTKVEVINGFRDYSLDELQSFISQRGLAMDIDDLVFCKEYFIKENRDPTITEIKMIDTYWSDHCRHTTFNTIIDDVSFDDELIEAAYQDYLSTRIELQRTKPISLMDIGTLAAKYIKSQGLLSGLDESDEINACTVKINVTVDGIVEPWLLLFKNETHNHPTEIEPFGGAATCIGGAIRDPLSGRSYVYAAMRVTGASNPLQPVSETIPGKLPQRKLVTTAAAGYSSYGNQIGLATGCVDELYHPGYAAKRMEIGAVIGATPANNVIREVPVPGDIVILLGGSTGRDGIGGATGSSKAHTSHSVETCGAEVQKGNAPEERKLQRLFRNGTACRMIKRCNDFGAGGVSVAIGELADGLEIDLNAVPKKYEGLDGTELAISESQERMAVVVAPENVDAFLQLAYSENLQASPVAVVRKENRLVMNWNGSKIVDISREFLDTNGAEKHVSIHVSSPRLQNKVLDGSFSELSFRIATDLNCCSRRGLSERFDSTIGSGTVLMPFGGKYQQTPIQAMVQKISVEKKHTDDCSVMAWGFNPYLSEQSPFHGAYLAVVESVCKLIATGADFSEVYLSFQEYFEKLGRDAYKWGKPFSALLGAFEAQKGLGVAAIGGKDSMSGSCDDLNVPPTLVSFAVTTQKVSDIISPEFKESGHPVVRIAPTYNSDGLPDCDSLIQVFNTVTNLIRNGKAVSCYTPGFGGIAEAIMKMSFGNKIGFIYNNRLSVTKLFEYDYGAFILELNADLLPELTIGFTTDEPIISNGGSTVLLEELLTAYESVLEPVYSCNIPDSDTAIQNFSNCLPRLQIPHISNLKPKVLIPAFPGTNCEYDSAKAMLDAGADPEVFVINNLSADGISKSIELFSKKLDSAQIVFIPGGFSGGDEPDGSGKFITAFFRNASVKEGVERLLDQRGGLMCGICNGFQALIKLGLVPYGKIIDTDAHCPTLTFNTIARHQSRIVRTRIVSNLSPWLSLTEVGDVYSVPISHGEGRFLADENTILKLASNGQIATQYVDLAGNASNDIHYNPNGSLYAVEGITSPDGRVFGKMGHAERIGSGLYKNVPGDYDLKMFASAVEYFRKSV